MNISNTLARKIACRKISDVLSRNILSYFGYRSLANLSTYLTDYEALARDLGYKIDNRVSLEETGIEFTNLPILGSQINAYVPKDLKTTGVKISTPIKGITRRKGKFTNFSAHIQNTGWAFTALSLPWCRDNERVVAIFPLEITEDTKAYPELGLRENRNYLVATNLLEMTAPDYIEVVSRHTICRFGFENDFLGRTVAYFKSLDMIL